MPRSSFTCSNCHREVSYKAPGTKNRNHCPYCLFSLHVDDEIGDRAANCGGLMEPVAKIYKNDGEEVLVHRCIKCAEIRKNRIAGDDSFALLAKLKEIDYF
jgi:DNA-directed RNA polymerase subunit RPC12/RpoP